MGLELAEEGWRRVEKGQLKGWGRAWRGLSGVGGGLREVGGVERGWRRLALLHFKHHSSQNDQAQFQRAHSVSFHLEASISQTDIERDPCQTGPEWKSPSPPSTGEKKRTPNKKIEN